MVRAHSGILVSYLGEITGVANVSSHLDPGKRAREWALARDKYFSYVRNIVGRNAVHIFPDFIRIFMARVYDIAVAALAIGVDRKWLDNLTAQHSIPGTEHVARGVARRLSLRALLTSAIVRDLNRGLGVPVGRGVEIASAILGALPSPEGGAGAPAGAGAEEPRSASRSVLPIGESLTLAVDVERLEREIERRLLEAMETMVPRRRGRPPRKERRGTR